MAVSAFFLVGAEDHLAEARKAAWLYIAASHLATLCVFGVFAILYSITGTFDYGVLSDSSSAAARWLAVLALLGFGTKAGLMPLHVWLPDAHAQAPSHVSAIMSGVLIKMGIYGLARVATFFLDVPLWWGMLLLALGTISAVLGVAFAIGQHDIKRLLAYHSIENIGIIVMGIAMALIGRATGHIDWIVLGVCGGLLHVWNHALFKSLLFLGAGSVIHSVGTREIDQMGGLGRRMPATATFFLMGAVAICGLPPLNGFVSELLVYLGLFGTLLADKGSFAPAAAFAAPALALVGALAAACFVKVYGMAFLGAARSEKAQLAHESGMAMTAPMLVLAACCTAIGVAPALFVPVLDRVAVLFVPKDAAAPSVATVAPLVAVSIVAALLLALTALGGLILLRCAITAPISFTWDCGYAAPSARMQYTSSSFAQWLVDLFAWALRPREHQPRIETLFPQDATYESHVNDTVLDEAVLPGTKFFVWLFGWSRYLQSGSLQAYLFYILVITVSLLLWRGSQ
jgi:hydrogenase-4 component B